MYGWIFEHVDMLIYTSERLLHYKSQDPNVINKHLIYLNPVITKNDGCQIARMDPMKIMHVKSPFMNPIIVQFNYIA